LSTRRLVGAVAFSGAFILTAALTTASPVTAATSGPTQLPNGFRAVAVDGSTGRVFVSSPSSGTISVLDFAGNLLSTISGEAGPGAMVVNNGELYVALVNLGAIDVFNTSSLAKTATLGQGHLVAPGPLVMAGGKLWTSTGQCGNWSTELASVDPSSGAVSAFVMPSSTSLGYCINLAGDPANANTLMAWDQGLEPATITELDVSSGTPAVVATQYEQDQQNLTEVSVNPDGQSFVTASGYPYQYEEFSMGTLAQDGVIYPAGSYPNAVVTSPARGGLMVGGRNSAYGNDIDVYNLGAPGTELYTRDFGSSADTLYPSGLALSPDGSTLFAVSGDVYGAGTAFLNVLPLANGTATSFKANLGASNTASLTATVSVTSGAFPQPAGTVSFLDGGAVLATAAVSNGQATATVTLPAGNNYVTASYNGDINNQASGSPPQDIVEGNITSTQLVSSADPSAVGQAVTFTATVSGASSPTGSVAFYDSANLLATAQLSGTSASVTVSSLAVGNHNITAAYSGDSANDPSTSTALAQSVSRAATSVGLSAAPNPAVVGQAVTLTATLGGTYGTAGGTATFYDGSTALGTAAVSNGRAAMTVSFAARGTHSLTASYSGDANNAAATSAALSESVTQASSSTKLSASASKVQRRSSVSFTATVAASPAVATPTGSVTFYDGSSALATVALSGGSAKFSTSSLGLGTHTVTAVYGGCPAVAGSTSNAVTVQVTK